jgi:spore germination protein KB
MIEKGKISALQLAMMMYLAITPTSILTTPSILFKYAKQDLWISPIGGVLSGFITVYVAFLLHRMYPGQNIVQASERIVGRIPGKMIGMIILFYYLYLTGNIIREYGEFLVGAFLHQTPLIVAIATFTVFSMLTVFVVIPVVLFCIAWLKKRFGRIG